MQSLVGSTPATEPRTNTLGAISSAAVPAIKASLDAFVARKTTQRELVEELTAICAADVDSTWEVLSYLDQYHRRHLLPAPVFLTLKERLHARVLNVTDAPLTTPRQVRVIAPPAQAQRELSREPSAGSASTPLRVGSVLRERYELMALILRGGFGSVYRALDRQRNNLPHQDRYVAIKSLQHELPGPIATGVLQHEFQQTHKLSHPNIVDVYEVSHADEQSFMLMELVDGELLSRVSERLAPRRLPPPLIYTLVRELGLALVCAHEHDVMHGDIQPRNVAITHAGELRLMNFGQACTLRRIPWLSDTLDSSGLRMLDSAYCSPEIHKGIGPDCRDDLFGLACIMYELFAGQPPFAVGATSRNSELTRPKQLDRKQWRALQHALAYHRHDRPASIREWLEQLDLRDAAERLPMLDSLGRHCR